MPTASLSEFFQFLQCQLRMEAREVLEQDLELADPGAQAMWEAYERFVTPNLTNDRWVPYHTIFGAHEFFLVEAIHHRRTTVWNEKRRFLAIFIFRAHCRRDFFTEAQLPHLLSEDFWVDPVGSFRPGGPLENAMLEYRKRTRRPLLTLCFRMIPERVLKDDDQNLVRSIALRTQRLLEVAEQAWPIVKDSKEKPERKFAEICRLVQNASGLGETWAKMITVSLDLGYPKLRLLRSQSEVGNGALAPLRILLRGHGPEDPKEALNSLTRMMNCSAVSSSEYFWLLLPRVERLAQVKFKSLPLILEQVRTRIGSMSPSTLQVQLCEYRQFRNGLARIRFSLPLDASMKIPEGNKGRARRSEPASCEDQRKAGVPQAIQPVKPEAERRKRAARQEPSRHDDQHKAIQVMKPPEVARKKRPVRDAALRFDKDRRLVSFEVPGADGGDPAVFETLLAGTKHSRPLAERIAEMCLERVRLGEPLRDVKEFLRVQYRECQLLSDQDVPPLSAAWQECKGSGMLGAQDVNFTYASPCGRTERFQTTTLSTQGSLLEAERIARLCYRKFESGATREEVLAYRAKLYKELPPRPVAALPNSPAKRRRSG